MMLIRCVHCGYRNASEFRFLGEVVKRPAPDGSDRAAWRDYLYFRSNPAEWATETWYHGTGCKRFIVVERHRTTNEIRAVREPGSMARTEPDLKAGA